MTLLRSIARVQLLLAVLSAVTASASTDAPSAIDADATVHSPALAIPFSSLSSTEQEKFFMNYFAHDSSCELDGREHDINDIRRELDDCLRVGIAKLRATFPVDIKPRGIAGVQTDVIEPAGGIVARNKRRVLINLHGGGFMVGGGLGGQMESIPIAALSAIKVICVDYREGPEHKFPTASEDVAAVYQELLKSYPAKNIGIYGCSAGGVLTAESVAWFQTHGLPRPGAIGIFGAGALLPIAGDSNYLGPVLTGGRGPIDATWSYRSTKPESDAKKIMPYFDVPELIIKDPLVSPAYFPSVLAKFPPSLIISGTRDFELSPAVYTHSQLVKQGINADLHVWEGATHCAFGQPVADASVPETREAWDVTVKFFDKNLGK